MSVVAPLKKTRMKKENFNLEEFKGLVETELFERESRLNDLIEAEAELSKFDHPDAKMHQVVSFIKSGIRILGYLLIPFSLPWAAGILVVSEVVGIIEELV